MNPFYAQSQTPNQFLTIMNWTSRLENVDTNLGYFKRLESSLATSAILSLLLPLLAMWCPILSLWPHVREGKCCGNSVVNLMELADIISATALVFHLVLTGLAAVQEHMDWLYLPSFYWAVDFLKLSSASAAMLCLET
ncbi:hypothetical protein H0E87_009365 [Populus deltoides]|uniref:Uncharacterized protein n=1 Tax=Populus deltoides TaxID=3696 RepID=A0A8T2Z4X5_POPDE|nr:hypothetical protein H0E87_009365 [Populus deltoides]